ncbi:FecR family protein [Sphingopyxis sp. 22461]|uniref:FecR family protein n=1 Tax=Sphingopyxis sp. 22461 TaxID=3453923 RepID=UPI003F8476BC
MAETHHHRFEQDQLRREAGEWFVIMNDENVSEDDEREFKRWLARGALHRATYNRIASLHSAGKRVDWENLPPPKPVRGTAKRIWIAAIGCVALIGFVAWRMSGAPVLWSDATQIAQNQPEASLEYYTAPGEIREVLLPDGSRLTLDSDTSIRAWFRSNDRRLRLARGRARFDVAHETRPFIVNAGDSEIVAVGTVFDVAYRDATTVEIHLLRGAVDVRRPQTSGKAGTVRLEPGDELRYTSEGSGNLATVRKHEQESDWTDAKIGGRDTRVMDVIAAANSRSTIQIILEDPVIERRMVSGLNEADNPEMLADNLAKLYDLQLTRQDNHIILSHPRN